MKNSILAFTLLLTACASTPEAPVCEPCEQVGIVEVMCSEPEEVVCPECEGPDDNIYLGQVVCDDKIVWFGQCKDLNIEALDEVTMMISFRTLDDLSRTFINCYGEFEVFEEEEEL